MKALWRIDIALLVLLLLSALAVSWSVHEARRLTSESQALHAEHDRLQTEWGQLLLEHSTWGGYARVEQLARERLRMSQPAAGQRVVIKP